MTLRLIPPIAVPQSVPEVMGSLVGGDASAEFAAGVRAATGTTRVAWFAISVVAILLVLIVMWSAVGSDVTAWVTDTFE